MRADLVDFLEGLLAASAYRGKREFLLQDGVFDEAFASTVGALQKHAKRERVEFAFRMKAQAAGSPRSNVRRALRLLEHRGTVRFDPKRLRMTTQFEPEVALAHLAQIPIPLGLLDHGAKVLRQRYETARVRLSLRRLSERHPR